MIIMYLKRGFRTKTCSVIKNSKKQIEFDFDSPNYMTKQRKLEKSLFCSHGFVELFQR